MRSWKVGWVLKREDWKDIRIRCPGVDLGDCPRCTDQLARSTESARGFETHLDILHSDHLIDSDFNHVQHSPIERPDKGQPVRSLLAMRSDHEERGIVLPAEKL